VRVALNKDGGAAKNFLGRSKDCHYGNAIAIRLITQNKIPKSIVYIRTKKGRIYAYVDDIHNHMRKLIESTGQMSLIVDGKDNVLFVDKQVIRMDPEYYVGKYNPYDEPWANIFSWYDHYVPKYCITVTPVKSNPEKQYVIFDTLIQSEIKTAIEALIRPTRPELADELDLEIALRI
jgi:hypothetical protein